MAKHIASNVIKEMLKHGMEVQNASVNVLGLTFKENCPDLRNTKVIHIIEELASYGLEIKVNDVEADKKEAKDIFDIDLKDKEQMSKADVLIFAVSHKEYLENKSEYINLVQENGVIFDIKGVISDKDINESQRLWRL
ncbi:capsular polysaccharide biosynthesis protein CapL [Staphylococcus gallinarum]|nr:capsular polysaccharide biosynthesis protein CapL [Staphylococcus gallinarum]